MADKFPEIDTPAAGGNDDYEGDFLSREKEWWVTNSPQIKINRCFKMTKMKK